MPVHKRLDSLLPLLHAPQVSQLYEVVPGILAETGKVGWGLRLL